MTDDRNQRVRSTLPWADLMAFGLGQMKFPPAVFWNMTLHELNAAMVGTRRGTYRDALSRDVLSSLMGQFPDHKG